MKTLAGLANDILDNACPNGGIDGDWNTYVIETHCIAWRVTARKTPDGWLIRAVTSEIC